MTVHPSLVLVTGGTGFVGSHIILQLLEAGYHVRTTVRLGKTDQLLKIYPGFEGRLEVVEVEDVATGDFTTALQGVDALIHVASPILQNTTDAAFIIESSISGTVNIMKQAVACNVKKIVVTSSFSALFEADLVKAFHKNTVDETWWGSATEEDTRDPSHDYQWAYMASKPIAEKKAWEFAEKYSDVDLTTILPPLVYGAYVPNYPPAESRARLGTNEYIYHLIAGGEDGSKTYPRLGVSHFVSVKDVARAHVLALKAPPLPNGRRKRLILVAGNFTWPEAAAYLKEVRPELKDALEKDEAGPKFVSCAKMDMKVTKEVVGMEPENMIPWKECILETVDSLIQWKQHKGL